MSAQLPLACPFLGAHRWHRGIHGTRGVAAGARSVRAGAAVQRRGQGLRRLAPGQLQVSCCQGSGAGLRMYHRPAHVHCADAVVLGTSRILPPFLSLSLSCSVRTPPPLLRSLGSSLYLLFSHPLFAPLLHRRLVQAALASANAIATEALGCVRTVRLPCFCGSLQLAQAWHFKQHAQGFLGVVFIVT